MKFLLFFSILVFHTNLSFAYYGKNYLKDFYGLRGNVKSLKEFEFNAKIKKGQVKIPKDSPRYLNKWLTKQVTFRTDGLPIESINIQNIEIHRTVYQYDDAGIMVGDITYTIDNLEYSRTEYSMNSDYAMERGNYKCEKYNQERIYEFYYDDQGRQIRSKSIYIETDSPNEFHFIYEYDSLGVLRNTYSLDKDSVISMTVKYVYDEKGFLIRLVYYGRTGLAFVQYQYANDSLGNIVDERQIDSNGKVIYRSTNFYIYDGTENWILKATVFYVNDKPKYGSIIEREIEYYE